MKVKLLALSLLCFNASAAYENDSTSESSSQSNTALVACNSGQALSDEPCILDSTREKTVSSGVVKWDPGNFGACNAPAASCGTTSGVRVRPIYCTATYLDGTPDRTVDNSLCADVPSLGSMPGTTTPCTTNWGTCPPPAPPVSSGL